MSAGLWNATDTRHPDSQRDVLAYDGVYMHVAFYVSGVGWCTAERGGTRMPRNPTHWRELPERPKAGAR